MNKIEQKNELHRGIGQRQFIMLAIGGSIGTGLFLASGSAIQEVGPRGVLFAYVLTGMIVYFMMTSIGEMTTQLPIPGGFQAFATRFIDPALGTAFGWNYWFFWAITLAAQLVAAAIIIRYWLPDVSGSAWAALFFVLLAVINLLPVKVYAEAQFWFVGIKVITFIVALFVGILLITGVVGDSAAGFGNWFMNDGDGGKASFARGFSAVFGVLIVAGFSFQGIEGIGIAAAEAKDPEKTIPKAIKTVFWCILIFNIGVVFIVGTLVPSTNPIGADVADVSVSPFTVVFGNTGVVTAATIVNAIMLIAILSCGNAALYMSSRMLYAMSIHHQAPKFFSKVNKYGVPVFAVCTTGAVGLLACLTTYVGADRIYAILYNALGQAGFIAWLGIAMTHYRFRKAWVAQGLSLNDLKLRSKFYPAGPILTIGLSLLCMFGANRFVFLDFNWTDFLIFYGFFPVFGAIYAGFKVKRKTKVVPLMECDFSMPEEGAGIIEQ